MVVAGRNSQDAPARGLVQIVGRARAQALLAQLVSGIERARNHAASEQGAQRHAAGIQRHRFCNPAGHHCHTTCNSQSTFEFLDCFVATTFQRAMGVQHRTRHRHAGILATIDDGVFHVALLLALQQFVERSFDLPWPAPQRAESHTP